MYGWKEDDPASFWEFPPCFRGVAMALSCRELRCTHFLRKKPSRFEAAEQCLGRAVDAELADDASSALLRLAQLMLQVLALRFRKPPVTWVAGEWVGGESRGKSEKATIVLGGSSHSFSVWLVTMLEDHPIHLVCG